MHDLIIPLGGLLLGVVGSVVGWFVVNRYGRSLVGFWDLRKNVQQAFSRSPTLAESESKYRLLDLAAEADSIRVTLPNLLSFFLHRVWGYDLEAASEGLRALANQSGIHRVPPDAYFRVQAQEALGLRSIDQNDRDEVQRWHRLKDRVDL